jgi:hypothetical protein
MHLGMSGPPRWLSARAAVLSAVVFAALAVGAAPPAVAAPFCVSSTQEPNLGPNSWVVEEGEEVLGLVQCSGDAAITLPGDADLGEIVLFNGFPGEASFRYTAPPDGAPTTDSFDFEATDASGTTILTVNISVVEPVNEAPECSAILIPGPPPPPPPGVPYEIEAGDVVNGVVTCIDDEEDEVSYRVEDPAGKGEVRGLERVPTPPGEHSIGWFTYQSDPGETGPDSFTLVANDGQLDSNQMTVSVNLTPAQNDAPVCGGGPLEAESGEPILLPSLHQVCFDLEGDALAFVLVEPPDHGQISGPDASGRRSYVSDAGFTGSDSFSFKANDGELDSEVVSVAITVGPFANDAPVCAGGSLTTVRNDALELPGGCTDDEGDELTFSLVDPPDHGDIVGPDAQGHFWYLPDAGFTGADEFTYKANDGTQDSNVPAVSITVSNSPGSGPSCQVSNLTVGQGMGLSGSLLCGGGAVSYQPVAAPLNGTLTGPDADGQFAYVPDPGYAGPDFFVYRASEGANATESGVLIQVVPGGGAVSGTLPPGGTLGTGAEPTGTDPLVTSLSTPNAGPVSIAEGPLPGGAPAGFSLLGQQVQITAPDATATDPLTLTFTLDAAALPTGIDEQNLHVFRNGTLVAGCAVSGGVASPDPCVSERERMGTGDVRLTVLSSQASTWAVGRALPTTGGGGGGGSTGGGTGGGGGAGGGETGGGGTGGGGTGAGPGGGNPPGGTGSEQSPPGPCDGLTGARLGRCKLDQRVARKCGRLRSAKRKLCAKRIRALARCNAIKARTAKQKRRKASCIRKAKAIGKKPARRA